MPEAAKAAVRERVMREAGADRRAGLFTLASRRLAAGVAALTLLTGGLAYAANGAMPGDALYGLKRAGEELLVALLPPGALERSLLVELAARRAEEALRLGIQGDDEQAQQTLRQLEQTLERTAEEQGPLAEDETSRIMENAGPETGPTYKKVEEIVAPGPSPASGPGPGPNTSDEGDAGTSEPQGGGSDAAPGPQGPSDPQNGPGKSSN